MRGEGCVVCELGDSRLSIDKIYIKSSSIVIFDWHCLSIVHFNSLFFDAPLSSCSQTRFFLTLVLCSWRSCSSSNSYDLPRLCKCQLMYIFASKTDDVRSIDSMCDWRTEFSARGSLVDVRLSFFHSDSLSTRSQAMFTICEAAERRRFAFCRAAVSVNLWFITWYSRWSPERRNVTPFPPCVHHWFLVLIPQF